MNRGHVLAVDSATNLHATKILVQGTLTLTWVCARLIEILRIALRSSVRRIQIIHGVISKCCPFA
jgi:hypothetical protein